MNAAEAHAHAPAAAPMDAQAAAQLAIGPLTKLVAEIKLRIDGGQFKPKPGASKNYTDRLTSWVKHIQSNFITEHPAEALRHVAVSDYLTEVEEGVTSIDHFLASVPQAAKEAETTYNILLGAISCRAFCTRIFGAKRADDETQGRAQIREYFTQQIQNAAVRNALTKSLSLLALYYCRAVQETSKPGDHKDPVYETSSEKLLNAKLADEDRAVEMVWLMRLVFDRVLYEEFPFDWFNAQKTMDIEPLTKTKLDGKANTVGAAAMLQEFARDVATGPGGKAISRGFLRADNKTTWPISTDVDGERVWAYSSNTSFVGNHAAVERTIKEIATAYQRPPVEAVTTSFTPLNYGLSRIVSQRLLGWMNGTLPAAAALEKMAALREDFEPDLEANLILSTFDPQVDLAYLDVSEGVVDKQLLNDCQRRVVQALWLSPHYVNVHYRLTTMDETRIRYHNYVRWFKRVTLLRSIVSTRRFLQIVTQSEGPPAGAIDTESEPFKSFVSTLRAPYRDKFAASMGDFYRALDTALDGGPVAFSEVDQLQLREGVQLASKKTYIDPVGGKKLIPDLNQQGQQQVVRVYEAGSIPLCKYKPNLPAKGDLTTSSEDQSELTTVVSEIMHLLLLTASDDLHLIHNYKTRNDVHAVSDAKGGIKQCARWTSGSQKPQPNEARLQEQLTDFTELDDEQRQQNSYLYARHPLRLASEGKPKGYVPPAVPDPSEKSRSVKASDRNAAPADSSDAPPDEERVRSLNVCAPKTKKRNRSGKNKDRASDSPPRVVNVEPIVEQKPDYDGPAAIVLSNNNSSARVVAAGEPVSGSAANGHPVSSSVPSSNAPSTSGQPRPLPFAPVLAHNKAAASKESIMKRLNILLNLAVDPNYQQLLQSWRTAVETHLPEHAGSNDLSDDLQTADFETAVERLMILLGEIKMVWYDSRKYYHAAIGAISCRSFMEKHDFGVRKDAPYLDPSWTGTLESIPLRLRTPFMEATARLGHEFFSRIRLLAPEREDKRFAGTFVTTNKDLLHQSAEVMRVTWKALCGYCHGDANDNGVNELFPRGEVSFHPLIDSELISEEEGQYLQVLADVSHTQVLDCLKGSIRGHYKVGARKVLEQEHDLTYAYDSALDPYVELEDGLDTELPLFHKMLDHALLLKPGSAGDNINVEDIRGKVSGIRAIDDEFEKIFDARLGLGKRYETLAGVQLLVVEHIRTCKGATFGTLRDYFLRVHEWYCYSTHYIKQLNSVAPVHAVLSTRTFLERLVQSRLPYPFGQSKDEFVRRGRTFRDKVDNWYKFHKATILAAHKGAALSDVMKDIVSSFPNICQPLYKKLCDVVHNRPTDGDFLPPLRKLFVELAGGGEREFTVNREADVLRLYEARYLRATLFRLPDARVRTPLSHPVYLEECTSPRDLIAEAVHYIYLAHGGSSTVHNYHNPTLVHTLIYRSSVLDKSPDRTWITDDYHFPEGYAEACCTWWQFLDFKCPHLELFQYNREDVDEHGTLPHSLVPKQFAIDTNPDFLLSPAENRHLNDISVDGNMCLYFAR